MKTKQYLATSLLAAALCASLPATALEPGDMMIRVGAHTVAPDVDSETTPNIPGGQVDVSDGTSLTITLGYMLTSNIALDVLAALPFAHDIEGAGALEGAGVVAEVEHLPPTISAQYHFAPDSGVRPYVGLGVNYTTFTDVDEVGALAGDSLDLDDSIGLAVQGGVDVDLSSGWFVSFDVRYMQIETEANSATTGRFNVTLDPWVAGFAVGKTF